MRALLWTSTVVKTDACWGPGAVRIARLRGDAEQCQLCACRYRSLAGHSLRALRLDLALSVLHYLQDLPSNKWACEEEEATEVNTPLML